MVSSLNLNYSFSDTHTLPYNIKRIRIQDRFELYLDPDPDSKGTKDEQEILLTRFFIKGFTDLWQMKSQSRYFVILTFDHHGTVRWFWIGRLTLAFRKFRVTILLFGILQFTQTTEHFDVSRKLLAVSTLMGLFFTMPIHHCCTLWQRTFYPCVLL